MFYNLIINLEFYPKIMKLGNLVFCERQFDNHGELGKVVNERRVCFCFQNDKRFQLRPKNKVAGKENIGVAFEFYQALRRFQLFIAQFEPIIQRLFSCQS
jgi:hypothetical protein